MPNPGSEAENTPQAPVQAQSGERVVATNIGGKIYQVASDDDYLNHVQGEFEPHMVKLFRSLVGADDVVLDIGANIGCMSILFGDMARQVFSFEPSPSTFVFLDRNIRAAGCRNVTPVNLGLGKEGGSFELTFAKSNRSGGFVSNLTSASTGHQIEKIEIASGDAYIDQQDVSRVDFIKIDVEGFEKNVIEGLAETISRDKPIVTLELNHWCLNAFQRTSVPDFFDFLRGVFPYLYAVDVDDARNLHNNDDAYHVMYYHIVGGFKYANIVGAFDREQLAGFAQTYNLNLN
jgi:FkbM family methyltransferase